MQNQNWRFLSRVIAVATVTVLVVSFTTLAAAQDEAVRAMYQSAASIPTNMAGIRTYAEPPAGFNALTASDLTLASYGIPPRPDRTSDPAGYAKWAKVMTSGAKRWNGELKPGQFHSTPMKPANAPPGNAAAVSPSNGAQIGYSYNWSGVVNTNTLKKYNAKTSFYFVFSEFNVPWAQQAFATNGGPDGLGSGGNICDGGYDIVAIWNGLDGFTGNGGGDVLQGGTASEYYCKGSSTAQYYFTWIEWYPAGSAAAYNVNPGDDIYVETWNTSDTQGNVSLFDLTLQTYATYALTAPSGTTLVGNSAEFIVERPCCRKVSGKSYFYPLANYIADFWDYSGDYTFKGVLNDPGSTATTTWVVNMINDANTQVISVPNAVTNWNIGQGLTGSGMAGKFSIFFQDENCAYIGGCAF